MIPTFWQWSTSSRVRQALQSLMADGELDGLIVDMRINGGGLITMLKDTLSIFTAGELGAFVSRDSQHPLVVRSRPVGNSLDVPLVILVGRETRSAGEIFSGVLQENGRAQVVGRRTEGNVETIQKVDLEDGSRVWLAREIFLPTSGTDWEERGIVPDLEIPLDWDEFTPENDPQLEAALDWLLNSRQN
jgi:carboxyl-terminal processing protease